MRLMKRNALSRAVCRAALAGGCLLATGAALAAGEQGAGGTAAGAQAADQDVTSLQTVTVSASRNDTALQSMPQSTTLITREDISKSPAQTLDQLLRSVPGFNFTGMPAAISDPTGQQTKMRGLGNAKVLVLVDGIPALDPFYLTTQWYKIPLNNIERVEVIRGGGSSLWGSMAVAGVVNIITRRGKDNAGELTASVGNMGTSNFSLSQSFKVSDRLGFNLVLNQYDTKGYIATPAIYRWKYPGLQPTTAVNRNAQLTTYFNPTDTLSGFLRVGMNVQDQDIGYPQGRNLQKSPDLSLGLDQRIGRRDSLALRAWTQSVRFNKTNGASCYYQGGGVCQNSSTAGQTPSATVIPYYAQHSEQSYKEQGTTLTYSKFINRFWNSVQMGVDYRQLHAVDNEWFYKTPTSPATPQVLNATTYGQGNQTFKGAFVQTKLTPWDPLEITLSGRYDAWDNDDQINTLTKGGTTSGGPVSPSRKSAFNPGLGIHYDATDHLSFRAAAYQAFRAPGFNNTTRSYGYSPTTVANPGLAPETMKGWELGGDYARGPVKLSATYFSYNIRDMIATYRVASAATAPQSVLDLCGTGLANCGGSASYYTNNQNGRSHGVELAGSWQATRVLTLDAWLTVTDTFLTSKAAAITTPLDTQLAGVPKTLGSLGVNWDMTDRLHGYAQMLYIGPMYIDETTTPGVNYGQGSNTIYNLSASYALTPKIDLLGHMVNVFNHPYSENAYTVTQPWTATLSAPRTFDVGVRVKF